MTISELNYSLLQLIRDYREALLYREAYKIRLLGYEPDILQQPLQAVLGDAQLHPSPRFEKAEQALLDGNDPRTVLEEFLKK